MTAPAVVAGALALALVVLPGSPRQRLTAGTGPIRRVSRRAATGSVGCMAVAVVLLVPAAPLLAGAMLTGTVALRCRRNRRFRGDAAQRRVLEAALDVLVGELRVGAEPLAAISGAAADTAGTAVSAGLATVAARARLGADVATGLRTIVGPSTLAPYWERLAVCWQLATRHGLAVATLMRAAQRDVAGRQRFSAQVSAALAGTRATAAILAGLPLLGLLLGQLIGAAPIPFLLGDGGGGRVLLAGVTLVCAGMLWSDRIVGRVLG